jgi:predicted porin
MFKKTLIAAAVATMASSVAMADVKIGGKVEQQQQKSEAGEWSGWSDVRLTVSGDEDLGNGMSAFFKFQDEMGLRTGAGAQQYDQLVGLKSSAGTLIMGKVEDFTESKVMSMTDKTMGAGSVEIGANLGRNEGAIAYVSPSFSGLTVGVAGYALSASGGDQDAFDAVDLGLMYSNGPLSVNVAFENDKRAATAATAATAAFDSGDSTSIGASYAAGDLTVAATQQMTSYDTAGKADEDDTSIAVTYNMGNNKVVVGWNDNETSAGATVTETEVSPFLPAKVKSMSCLNWFTESSLVVSVLVKLILAPPVIETSAIETVAIVAATAAINNCFFILKLLNL